MSDVKGREGLSGAITELHAQQPGASLALASGIDQHHNQVRFRWDFIGADGKTPIQGSMSARSRTMGGWLGIMGFRAEPPGN